MTGNVEGIARKKMRATGILATKALSAPAPDQTWDGDNDSAFLGGFGSDYCSGDIEDMSRINKDRGEQIVIACNRARSMLRPDQQLVRVVHVGDAPADLIAAKWCYEEQKFGADVVVGCVGVATGMRLYHCFRMYVFLPSTILTQYDNTSITKQANIVQQSSLH